MPNTLDHRGVIEFIRQDRAASHVRGQGAERGHVRNVTRREQQRGLLAMEIRKFPLEENVVVVGAGNIARTTSSRAATVQRFMHRRKHFWVLTHAEIIVRAPHHYVTETAGMMLLRPGKPAGASLQIGERAVAFLSTKALQLPMKMGLVIHSVLPSTSTRPRVTRD